jgi:molybdopterin-synthase adenylyltransferase
MDRYLSQRLYKNIGKKGQYKLKKASAAIIGIGALGTTCAELLARAGVGKITLIDRDIVELSNLQRQVLFDEADIGKPKAAAAKEKLSKINSEVEITAKNEDLDYKNVKIVGRPNIVIAATDNMESRFLLNDYCLKNNIPLVYGGAVEDRGSIFSVIKGRPCLRCIFHGSTEETCDNSGILNTCSLITGSMMAGEAIKIIISGNSEKGLLCFNVWVNSFSKIKVKNNPKCPACMGNYQYLEGEIKTKTVSLCGQGTYHIRGNKKNLFELSKKLSKLGEIKKFGNVIQFDKLTLFEDGRAIIKASSEKEAKATYSKYIGN